MNIPTLLLKLNSIRLVDQLQVFHLALNKKSVTKSAKSIGVSEDITITLTDAQRYSFASKLSELPEMGKLSQGTESYEQFAVRIADMLKQPEKLKELTPLLRKVGFQ